MKSNVFFKALNVLFFLSLSAALYAKPEVIPDWVLNWQTVYPDSEYIAQKGTGKKADEAKSEALANLSYYFNSSVTAVRESNYNSLQTMTNGNVGKVKEVSSLETIRDTAVTSHTELVGVEYTEPYYNRKDRTWHCVCYISRKIIWDKNEPALRVASENFKAFYNKANDTSDVFEKIRYLAMASEKGFGFVDKYSECQFYSEKLTGAAYGADMLLLSSLDSLIQEQKNKCRIYIDVNKDSGNQVYSAVSQVLSGNGFTVTRDRQTSTHVAKCFVDFENTLQDNIFIYNPSIEISIMKDGNISYSYSTNCGRIKVFTKANGEKKSFEEINKRLNEGFDADLKSALGIEKKEL